MKRLTDAEKWKNPWFRSLPSKFKLLFLYLLDNCDHAGVMHLDPEFLRFYLGEDFSLEEIRSRFQEKIIFVSEDKIIIKNFIRFQQPRLSLNGNMRKHIENCLLRHNLLDRYHSGEF